MLDIAVLGFLDVEPMHGYQIRKVLTEMSGTVRGFSYGSLYPVLNRLEENGFIESPVEDPAAHTRRKAKKVYRLTDAGHRHFLELLSDINPTSFTDEDFGVRLAFFDKTPADARRRLLEGRRRLLEERRDHLMSLIHGRAIPSTNPHNTLSPYSQGLNKLTLESTQREISWVNSLIQAEEDDA